MGSAVNIVLELYDALSERERAEVIDKILAGETPKATFVTGAVSAEAKEFGDAVKAWATKALAKPKATKRVWKKLPYWTKTVESVDKSSVNASGADGKWGFEPGTRSPVLLGLNKPRHLYAVLKGTPGETAVITDEDGFNVEVDNATVVMTSKDWVAVREQLSRILEEF
jgi:hypothetical protein